MGLPKSVTRISRGGVTYTSSVDRASFTIKELSRAALRDVAKLVKNKMKSKVPIHTGNLKSNIGSWVRKKLDGNVELQVGIYSVEASKRKGKVPAYHAHLLEFGTVKMPPQAFLQPSVYENIDDIRKIEGQYLSQIDDENRVLGLIQDESEEVE